MEIIDITDKGTEGWEGVERNLDKFAEFESYATRYRKAFGSDSAANVMLLHYYTAWKVNRMYQALVEGGENPTEISQVTHEVTAKMMSAFQSYVDSYEAGDAQEAMYHAKVMASGVVWLERMIREVIPIIRKGEKNE